MVDISEWMQVFVSVLEETFGERVWFVGLQGSYARWEARETSDIDPVVILDELTVVDIETYRAMLDRLPHRALICGFFGGKKDLLNWAPADLFQLYFDTRPVKGSLDELRGLITDEAVEEAVRTGGCNIYHGCVHNMLHGRDEGVLKELYKAAGFVLRAVCFRQKGVFVPRLAELRGHLAGDDRSVAETCFDLKKGEAVRFREMSDTLFSWVQKWV